MASTFSQTLRLELIGDGDQSGLWGQTTNTNLGTLLEQAITGVVNITMADANYTLTNFNGVSDEARNAVLVVGGTNAAVRDIIAPLVEKLYVVKNSTSGGYAVNIRGSSGSSVSVPNGGTVWVYCDGTNFNAVGTETVGNFEVNGNLTVTGNTNAANATYTGNVAALNFSGAGLTLTSINASNISAGTIANARTTADSANGASTIVARDANGSFTANAITTTSISGNGVALTAINASNITSGTIANARTTAASANGASTIVARDADGSFAANVVSATNVSATNVSATNVSATNVAYTGTLTGGTGVVNIGSGQVYKDASGNVGIGTNNPDSVLHVDKSGVSASLRIGFTGASQNFYDADTQFFRSGNGTERMRIDSSGDVGIGTSSPNSKLHVYGSQTAVLSESSINSDGAFRAKTTLADFIFGAGIGTASNCWNLYDAATSTELMRINSNGNVFFNNTTGSGKVNIQNASEGQLHLFYDATYSWRQGPNSGGSYVIYRNTDSVGVFLAWGGTSWSSNSDERLKTNLKPIENAIDKVSTLRTVTGRYKTDSEDTSRVFLIAQDVQAVLPEAVNVQGDEQKTLGLSYTDMIPLLTAAIKEQQAIINDLKARIETLENKND